MNQINDEENRAGDLGGTEHTIRRERIGDLVSRNGISKESFQDESLTEDGIVTVESVSYGVLDCRCLITNSSEIGGISACCNSILCKNHITDCRSCGRKLCPRHRRSFDNKHYCTKHWILKILGL